GKTNILEAISLLSPGRGLRRATPAEFARRPEMLGWKIKAEIGSHQIETYAEAAGPRSVLIDGKGTTQVDLGRVTRILWLVPAMDRLWLEGAEGRRRFLDRMVLSFVPAHADAVLAYEKAMRERNRLLRENIRDWAWYGALEQQMAEAGAEVAANRRLALLRIIAAQEGAETAFPAAELSIFDPDRPDPPETAEALALALADGRSRDMAAGRTLCGPHRTDLGAIYAAKGVPAAQCSTGEQKALLVSLILANARTLHADVGGPPILLLDEIAAHLDAGRRAALYDEVCALGCQAFMTGTGAELFDGFGPRASYFEVSEQNGASVVNERTAP
ncbi:MAG: DNA replication/repair protein RecF, partial [Paracoccaceae bacterium]